MDQIILYSTGCPKCKVLEARLRSKGIDFIHNDNVDEMMKKGFTSVPMLEVNGNVLSFKEALQWVNKQ